MFIGVPTAAPNEKTVAFIGLGRMGLLMVADVFKAEFRLMLGVVGLALVSMAPAARADTGPSGDQRLHLATAPEDFASLGIGKDISVWEDGRRTPRSSDFFEWWYFDGLLDDGTVVVVWFGDNWLYGSHKRTVNIEVTPPGKPTRDIRKTFSEPGSFASDRADVRIGPHRFEGNLDTYSIFVDPAQTGGVGCDLALRRRVPSFRPATGYIKTGDKFFAWLAAVPEGSVTGTLTIDGATRPVTGSGYHDHNWGNTGPDDLFDGWWWGRSRNGEYTVIASVLHGKEDVGGANIPLVYVGRAGRVEVDAFGSDVMTTEGAPVRHPDPAHSRTIRSSVSFAATDGSDITFRISDHLLASSNLLDETSFFTRLFAGIVGVKPWYTRFDSHVTLKLHDQSSIEGRGTLENYELK